MISFLGLILIDYDFLAPALYQNFGFDFVTADIRHANLDILISHKKHIRKNNLFSFGYV